MNVRVLLLSLCLALAAGIAVAKDWPEFRGPNGQGIAEVKALPLSWSNTEQIAWKVPVGGGWSSPILIDDQIILTSAVPEEGKEKTTLRTLCLEAATGKTIWDTVVFTQDANTRIHSKNSHASPTPLCDGKRIFVHFGTIGTAALDREGKVLWTNQELKYEPVHGNGGSPILVNEKLIFSCDGGDIQFVVGLEAETGKIAWKTDRETHSGSKFAFSTPLAIEVAGKTQVISPGAGAVVSYNPEDGKEIWRVDYGEGYSVIPRPVFGHGLLFVSSGYNRPIIFAIRPDGEGDVTKTHVAWESNKAAPHTPSLLLVGDELYSVSDNGIAACFDAKTGTQHWQERVGGNYSASPIYAAGRIYVQSEQGDGVVFAADKTEYRELARNSIGERTLASYAAAEKTLFIRTAAHLYRIEGE